MIAGAVLQQLEKDTGFCEADEHQTWINNKTVCIEQGDMWEENDHFDTVPWAMYWILARMINFRQLPHEHGAPYSIPGTVVVACMVALQAVLTKLLPFAQIS